MFGLKHQNWVNINIAEFLTASQYISNARLGMIMRKLCRAATFDRWNSLNGSFDFSMGDKAFKPHNIWEARFWESARKTQREMFIKLHQQKIEVKENAQPKPKPAEKPDLPKPMPNKEARAKINDLLNKIGTGLSIKRQQSKTVVIYPDTKAYQWSGRLGDFMRDEFTDKTLHRLTAWLLENWLGRDCKITTIIKTACKIESKDYNMVMAEYLRNYT